VQYYWQLAVAVEQGLTVDVGTNQEYTLQHQCTTSYGFKLLDLVLKRQHYLTLDSGGGFRASGILVWKCKPCTASGCASSKLPPVLLTLLSLPCYAARQLIQRRV